jgi:hypothetical protein
MTDQIVFFQRKDHVRESSKHTINVSFRDRATAALTTPTTIHYKITDLGTGYVVLDWTSVSAGDEITLTITPTQNALQSQCEPYEVREVAVKANSGLSTQFIDSVTYRVENLAAVT